MSYDLCLIEPPRPYLVDPNAQAHLGLMYLAASATRDGLWTCIRRASDHAIPAAACYGITGTYLDAPEINRLLEGLKQEYPDARLLVGGPVSLSRAALRTDLIDTIVHGPAEADITRLATQPHDDVHTCRVPDVHTLAWPARQLWPPPQGGSIFTFPVSIPGPSTVLLSSRGCPYSCAFCAGPSLSPRRVQGRESGEVVAEMERCVVDLGIRQFRFCDEHLTARPGHVSALCLEILKSQKLGHGKGIVWRASAGVRPHDRQMFELMQGAGCRELSFGVESGDPDVLAALGCLAKGSPRHAHAALRNARAAGLTTRALMMIGCPGSTQYTVDHDGNFLRASAAHRYAIAVFHPIPGSAVARDPAKFRCTIRTDLPDQGLCLFGPDGPNRLEPTVDLWDFGRDELRATMEATVAAALASGKLPRPSS